MVFNKSNFQSVILALLVVALFTNIAYNSQSDVRKKITLAQKIDIPFGTSFVLSDIDNDGNQDAVIVNYSNDVGAIQIWNNNGDGMFSDSGKRFGPSSCISLDIADINGDNHPDVFITKANIEIGNPCEVWFNDGKGNFYDSQQRLGQKHGSDVKLADLNGDNYLDAFVSNHVLSDGTKGSCDIWINNGKGIFSHNGQELGNGFSVGVSLADIDNDGDIDGLISTNDGEQGNTIWINNGEAFFTLSNQKLPIGASDLGDLNGDGLVDIVININAGSQVWLNQDNGIFSNTGQNICSSDGKRKVVVGDLDGDIDLDVFIVNGVFREERESEVWINDGNALFSKASMNFGSGDTWDVKLENLNGDDYLDVFMLDRHVVKIYLYNN